jgi:hypothetical protein
MTFEDEFRKKMIKEKIDDKKRKIDEGDSDLIFNKKDNKKSKK